MDQAAVEQIVKRVVEQVLAAYTPCGLDDSDRARIRESQMTQYHEDYSDHERKAACRLKSLRGVQDVEPIAPRWAVLAWLCGLMLLGALVVLVLTACSTPEPAVERRVIEVRQDVAAKFVGTDERP